MVSSRIIIAETDQVQHKLTIIFAAAVETMFGVNLLILYIHTCFTVCTQLFQSKVKFSRTAASSSEMLESVDSACFS